MAVRKEIKFKVTTPRSGSLEGRQDGVIYRIFPDRDKIKTCAPAYSVTATDTKGKGRDINTGRWMYFHLDAAKEFCQGIAAGEIDLESLRAEFEAKAQQKEQAAIRAATEEAKAFRDYLDKFGLKYSDLLDLEARRGKLDHMTHNILVGLEDGEGFPPCMRTSPCRWRSRN